jgi:hypothetical protein
LNLVVLLLLAWPLLAGCARPGPVRQETAALYQTDQAGAPPAVAATLTPAFLAEKGSEQFNKIGTPAIRAVPGGGRQVLVDPARPAIFYEIQEFRTAKGHYTNLIYRIHFPEVPLDWDMINLTAGRNPGILIIYTLDDRPQPVLITTVHTCGCYLAFLPTAALPRESYPEGWPEDSQEVYGYTLPSRLPLPRAASDDRVMFTLASQTHRIRDVSIVSGETRNQFPARQTLAPTPMHALFALPYELGTTSLFETEGCRAGYVKDSLKILERLFMSWWAFDLHVGEDKAYSVEDPSGRVFYTSLKFWQREASDMKDFPKFLAYWGWGL